MINNTFIQSLSNPPPGNSVGNAGTLWATLLTLEVLGVTYIPPTKIVVPDNSSINGHLSGVINAGIYPGISREICSTEHQILPSIGPSWQSVGTSDTSHHGIVLEANDFSYSSLRAETRPLLINSPPLLRTSLLLARQQLQFPGERSKRCPVQHQNHHCQQGHVVDLTGDMRHQAILERDKAIIGFA